MKCVDCFNFKTREVNKNNLSFMKEIISPLSKVKKVIKQKGKAIVYYCTYQLTPSSVYIEHETKQERSSALRTEVVNCKMGDF